MRRVLNNIKNLYYRLKWTLWAYIKYFLIVGGMRPWDYLYVIKMLRFQLTILERCIRTNDRHVDSSTHSDKIVRVCSHLTSHIGDDYVDRCGFDNNFNFIFTPVGEGLSELTTTETEKQYKDNTESIKWGAELEDKEWNETFELLKNMRGWWD